MTNTSETKLTGEVNKTDRSIDRLKTCPLLLRVFSNRNRHHIPKDYEHGATPNNELQIYTWMDATLGELTQLIKEVTPDVQRSGVQFSFAIVSADDSYDRYHVSSIGRTENGQRRADDQVQLGSTRFRVGDYLDVAIIYKRPEPSTSSSSNARRDRPQQPSFDDKDKRRGGQSNERNGGGPVRSAPRGDHRNRPY